jgi:hypothetical protein
LTIFLFTPILWIYSDWLLPEIDYQKELTQSQAGLLKFVFFVYFFLNVHNIYTIFDSKI